MANINSVSRGVFGAGNLLLGLWAFYRLIVYLSFSQQSSDVVDRLPCCGKVFWPLLWNTLLLNVFILQHTVMKSSAWKELLMSAGVSATYCRLLYSFSSCVCLLLFMSFGVPLPGPVVWHYDRSDHQILSLSILILHSALWSFILLAILMRDPFELVGLSPPHDSCVTTSKQTISGELSQQRHVGLVAFLLILWINTTMTVDRFLVAMIFTLYVVVWNSTKHKVV